MRTGDWTVLVRVTVKRVSEAGGRLGSVAEAGGRTETDTDLQPPVSPLSSSCDLAVTLSDKVSSQNYNQPTGLPGSSTRAVHIRRSPLPTLDGSSLLPIR